MDIDKELIEAVIAVSELGGRCKELIKQSRVEAEQILYDYWIPLGEWAQMLSGDEPADVHATMKRMRTGKNAIIKSFNGEVRTGRGGLNTYRLIDLINHWVATGNLEPEEGEAYRHQVFAVRAFELTVNIVSLEDLPLLKKILPNNYPVELLEQAIKDRDV